MTLLSRNMGDRLWEWNDQNVLVLAAVGGTAVLWPVGVLLVWASPRWRLRDKLIATALPLGGLSFSLLVLPAGARGFGLSTPSFGSWLVEVGYYAGLLGAPLLAALYLGLRVGLPRRLLAGVLSGSLVILALGQFAFFLGGRRHPSGM